MNKISIKDIYVSNKMETHDSVTYEVKFYDKVFVNDFEKRKVILTAIIKQQNDNFEVIDCDNYSKEEVLQAIELANKSTYTIRHYDVYKKDIIKEDILGLRAILNLNHSNNIIDIELKE